MNVDLILAGIILLFALFGWITGFWVQILRLGFLAVSFIVAYMAGQPLGTWLAHSLGMSIVVGTIFGPFIVFFATYVFLSTIGARIYSKRLRSQGKTSNKVKTHGASWNNICGALLGGCKAFIIIFLLLNVLVLAGGTVNELLFKKASKDYNNSRFIDYAQKHNLVKRMLPDNPQIKHLINNPALFYY